MESTPSRYAAQIDLSNENDSHVLTIRLVGGGKRVLDVGCWTGDLGIHLAAHNLSVVGIEKDAEAAKVAAGRLDEVIVADIEDLDLAEALGGRTFDVAVFADVLEHLTDPVATLRKARSLLAPGGYVVASIPNIAHGSVRLHLLQGEFRYADVGLLDRTHLRFFTRDTMHELFEDAGFVVVETRETTVDPLLAPEIHVDQSEVGPGVLERVEADHDAFVYQFVVRAVPDDSNQAIRSLYRRERELTAEVAELRRSASAYRASRTRGLVQLSVISEHEDQPAWTLSVLEREIGRRLPESTVALLSDARLSPLRLRWSDGTIVIGGNAGSATPADRVAVLDAGPSRVLGLAGAVEEADHLLGVALLAGRDTKDEATDRLPMLRLLQRAPDRAAYVVVECDLGVIDDPGGFATVVARIAGPTGGIALVCAPDDAATIIAGLPSEIAAGVVTVGDIALDDVRALVAGAAGVVTTSATFAALAIGLGRPHALIGREGPAATFVASLTGGVADSVTSIDRALYRTSDPATYEVALATHQARIDDDIDRIVSELALLDIAAESSPVDATYVEALEASLVAVQQRIVSERTRTIEALRRAGLDRLLDPTRFAADSPEATTRRLEGVIDAYRAAIVDLQEALYAASRPVPVEPARGRGATRLARRVLRRLRSAR